MLDLLFVTSIVFACAQGIKDACTPAIPKENLGNTELYYKDIKNNVPYEQIQNNIKNGKYKLTESYPEPHRNPKTGKIIIENYKLYYEDAKKYGAWQAEQWVKRGKYNL